MIDYIVGSREWDARGRVKIATTRFLAAVAASWISFPLLNIAQKPEQHLARKREVVGDIIPEVGALPYVEKQSTQCQPTPLAGTTMDLTLLAASRALDAAVTNLWSRHKISRMSRGKWTDFEAALSHLADAGIFAVSAGAVMWAWFYLPDRLPRAYNEWIASAAQVDQRLVMTLRKARWGEFVYGRNTGQATLLQSMCKDYKWPTVWGDPAKTIPIPCEMVHMGTGPSCHWHAAVRFVRAFKFALAMYLPLQLLVRARSPSIRAFKQAVKDAIRSSAFLGAFIGLFYYSVCLSRTRIGPKIFSPKMITPMMWDQGLCVGAGCMMCGWSIFIEAPKRRQEVAFFVAPRAAATLFPRRYNRMVSLLSFSRQAITLMANITSVLVERTISIFSEHWNAIYSGSRKSGPNQRRAGTITIQSARVNGFKG